MCDLCICSPISINYDSKIHREKWWTDSISRVFRVKSHSLILSWLYTSHALSVCHLNLTTSVPSTHIMSSFCHCETCKPGTRTSRMWRCSSNTRHHGGWVRVNSVSKEITDDIVETPRTETLYKWLSLLCINDISRAVTAKLELDLDWFQINFKQDVELWL